eukprot:COSAG01_NODE_7253_length_3281_cov_3.142363_3_plen_39_part_00
MPGKYEWERPSRDMINMGDGSLTPEIWEFIRAYDLYGD